MTRGPIVLTFFLSAVVPLLASPLIAFTEAYHFGAKPVWSNCHTMHFGETWKYVSNDPYVHGSASKGPLTAGQGNENPGWQSC